MTTNHSLSPTESVTNDRSMPLGRANVYGALLMIPLAALLSLPYLALWGKAAFSLAWSQALDHGFVALGALVVGTLVHEWIHGLSWMFFGQKSRSAITYGFQLKTLTPYAHCREPMAARAYRLGAAMPGLLLGVVPWLGGVLLGNPAAFLFGAIFTIAALGDAMILWLLRDVSPDAQVIDHPTRAGCQIVEALGV